jgi:hypothetical protein
MDPYVRNACLDSTLTQPISSVFPASFRAFNARSLRPIAPNALCLNFTILRHPLVETAIFATSLSKIVSAATLMERSARNVFQKFLILKQESVLTAALLAFNAFPRLNVCLAPTVQLCWWRDRLLEHLCVRTVQNSCLIANTVFKLTSVRLAKPQEVLFS